MSGKLLSRERYGEAFWRAHREAWRHSELNQREYCEAQGIPLKAFGNWRAKFKAEPQPPSPKLLYRRRNLSHTLGHSLSHRLSHMTYGSPVSGPIVPPAREGHRRRFNEADIRANRSKLLGDELLVRVRACALRQRIEAAAHGWQVTPGHENSGQIEGPGHPRGGRRVVDYISAFCGACEDCSRADPSVFQPVACRLAAGPAAVSKLRRWQVGRR
jgi:hypothetical protein